MIAFVKRLAGRLVLIGLGMLAWQQSDFREVAAQQLQRAVVWFAPGTEGQLKQYQLQLEQTLEELLAGQKRLQTQAEQQAQACLLRREELARLDHLLACFRAASITGTKLGFPQQIFARSYTEVQIKELVQEMLNRRAELERQESTGTSGLSQALSAVSQRISEARCHLQNMPVYMALAAAGDAADHSIQIEQALAKCLQSSRETLAIPENSASTATADCARTQAVVLSALPVASGSEPTTPRLAVELPLGGIQASDFLTPTPQELADADPSTEITVSELQQALRELVRRSRSASGSNAD